MARLIFFLLACVLIAAPDNFSIVEVSITQKTMMWWAVWCVVMVVGAGAVPAPFYEGAVVDPLVYHWGNVWSPDETNQQLAEHSVEAWPGTNEVSGVNAPRYETLSDLREEHTRPKRKMPSLSINNPMEVLRQRLILEVARKQMREANQRQAFANRLFLQNVGKRVYLEHREPQLYSN